MNKPLLGIVNGVDVKICAPTVRRCNATKGVSGKTQCNQLTLSGKQLCPFHLQRLWRNKNVDRFIEEINYA